MASPTQMDRQQRTDAWNQGFTRRRFIAGAGMAGVASLGSQLVTSRASFAAQPGPGTGTLVVIFLRGGLDGLSVVVPAEDPDLIEARPRIAVRGGVLLPLDRGFGLNPALAPLHELWKRGQFTAVPAVSTPDISRSHFQAQDCLERGGTSSGATEGWLDRVLDQLEPGTPLRAVAQGATLPRSLSGDQRSLALRSIESFEVGGWDGIRDRTTDALAGLYSGFDHPLAHDASATLTALDATRTLTTQEYVPAATYPEGGFSDGMTELARLIKADVGLRVACIDLGGWDMHTNLGTVDDGDMKRNLTAFGQTMAAFAADLGNRFDDVTVVAMTEFGRRVSQNANAGTDHGHGAVVMLMGGRLAGGTIHGDWQGLGPDILDQGDVPGLNDYRDILGEVVQTRLGVGDLGAVFPEHQVRPLGVTR